MINRNFTLILLVLSNLCYSKDLGKFGDVFQITEPDLRISLIAEASKVNVDKYKAELTDSAKSYDSKFPLRELPSASKTSTRYLDMSVTIQQDIVGPIKGPDGEWHNGIIVPKGTKANPLHEYKPHDALLFIDAQDSRQLEFATSVLKDRPWDIQIVNTSGPTNDLSKRFNRPVFFATDDQLSRFDIKATPSLVYAAEGKYDGLMAITELSAPYTKKQINKVFPKRSE